MFYFWVENISNLCKLIVWSSQTLRSTKQAQGRDSVHMHQGIKCSGEKRIANQCVIFSGCFGTYYELQQILPENSISFNFVVSESTWLH